MKNKIEKINIQTLLTIFLIIQPIFEMKVFYNSVVTLIRVSVIGGFFIYYFIKDKKKKKYLILLYPILIIIYFFIHDLNARINFKSLVEGNFNYSTLKEMLYLVKMITPYLLIYSLYNSKINKKTYLKIIKYWILIIGLVIIIGNLFKFSYGTYSDAKIEANFLKWINNSTYDYKDLCSKGLFEYGNQISAILLMTLAMITYEFISKREKQNIIYLFINIFSLILLGTKVAVFGAILVVIYVSVETLIVDRELIKKNKINVELILVWIIFYIVILPMNPTFNRIEEHKRTAQTSLDITSVDKINNENTEKTLEETFEKKVEEDKYSFVLDNYKKQQINENFIEKRYPYTKDVDFWYEILKSDNIKKIDYRFLEKEMTKRVIEINNNKLDLFFGITNTRIQNIFNIEQDFVVQYYALGIIGIVIIFAPYFGTLFYAGYKIIKNRFKVDCLINIIGVTTVIMIFGISYYSGNLLNSLGFTIYLSVLYGISILEREKNKV